MSGNRSGALVLEQGHEGVREHFVRTVADEDMLRATPWYLPRRP
jgi:hypothetical protein